MSRLADRKRIIVAESELNRQLLADDLTAVADECAGIADRVVTIGLLGTALVRVAAGLLSPMQNQRPAPASGQTTLQRVITGTKLAVQVWNFWQRSRSET